MYLIDCSDGSWLRWKRADHSSGNSGLSRRNRLVVPETGALARQGLSLVNRAGGNRASLVEYPLRRAGRRGIVRGDLSRTRQHSHGQARYENGHA